jgi:MoaA/NifB/PqqE/SkfB family radical SAM enzyme
MPKKDAQLIDVISNLRQAKKAGCKFVDFTGGEPLLHPELPDFLCEAKKLGFITSVTTNCILYPKRAVELSHMIDLLHFSIDADNEVMHNLIRGVSSYTSVLESIEIAQKHNVTPDLLFTYTNQNINHFEGVYKLAVEKKLMIILDPVFEIKGRDPLHQPTHTKALEFAKLKGVYLNKAHLILRKNGGNLVRKPLCRAVDSTIVILPDNKLALPCFHHRIQQLEIGNTLSNLLSSEIHKESRRQQGRYSFCEGCHINCYFDPSYLYMQNNLFISSMLSKLSYSWTKYVNYKQPIRFFRRPRLLKTQNY